MKRYLAFFVVLFTIFAVSGWKDSESDKKEAEQAFIEIVHTYFTKDCDHFYSFVNDSIKIIHPYIDTILATGKLVASRHTCGVWDGWMKKGATIKAYLANYQIRIYSRQEFTTPGYVRAHALQGLEPVENNFIYDILAAHPKGYTNDDFLIIGNIKRSDSGSDIISDGLFVIVLRRTKSGWKIFATTA